MPSRLNGRLRVEISDNGRGLPVGFDWREVAQPGTVDCEHAGRRWRALRAWVTARRPGNASSGGYSPLGRTASVRDPVVPQTPG